MQFYGSLRRLRKFSCFATTGAILLSIRVTANWFDVSTNRAANNSRFHEFNWVHGMSSVDFVGACNIEGGGGDRTEEVSVGESSMNPLVSSGEACSNPQIWTNTSDMVACEASLPDGCFMDVVLLANRSVYDTCGQGWMFTDGDLQGFDLVNITYNIIYEVLEYDPVGIWKAKSRDWYDCRQAWASFPEFKSASQFDCDGQSDAYFGANFSWPENDWLYMENVHLLPVEQPPKVVHFTLRAENSASCTLPLTMATANLWVKTQLPWEKTTTTTTATPTITPTVVIATDWHLRLAHMVPSEGAALSSQIHQASAIALTATSLLSLAAK